VIESLNIGISHAGGMGDNLNLTAFSAAVKKQFPHSFTTVIISRFPEIFRDNKTIDRVIKVETAFYQKYVEENRNKFDIFGEYKYACKWYFSEKATQLKDVVEFKNKWEKNFNKKYPHIFDKFLHDIPAMDRIGKKHYDIAFDSGGVEGNLNEMFLSIRPEDYKAVEKFKGLRYVTISNNAAGGLQTKSWYIPYWEKVNSHLRKIGFIPIQVGVEKDEPLAGAERFIGSIFETAALIKGAYFNIGPEGGLTHVARVVGTRSIVLFGPTPAHVFGYPENINVRSNVCKPCWWRKSDWFTMCSLRNQKVKATWAPPCMMGLTPENVIKEINKLLKEKGFNMKYLEPSVDMDAESLKTSLFHKEKEILDRCKDATSNFIEVEAFKEPIVGRKLEQTKKINTILDSIGFENKKVLVISNGDFSISQLIAAQGNDVTIAEISEIRTLRLKWINKIKAIKISEEKVPLKDNSFDFVILANVLTLEAIWKFFSESERLVKEEGKIFIILPTTEGLPQITLAKGKVKVF
jgi:ADP-heptose:LPS heptosyltransferase